MCVMLLLQAPPGQPPDVWRQLPDALLPLEDEWVADGDVDNGDDMLDSLFEL